MLTTAEPRNAETSLAFTTLPHPATTSAAAREAVLASPGFGTAFSDHMISIDWSEERGWHNATLGPRGPIALDPAAAVLHYAQEIFEGLKAYKTAEGGIALFRPEANAARFNASARRLAMPELPEDVFVDAVKRLVLADRDSLLTLARDEGLTLREDRYSIDQWRKDSASGRLVETFACGTAAVVTPVGKVCSHEGEFTVGAGGPGPITQRLKDRLVAIQRGAAADPHGWMTKLA